MEVKKKQYGVLLQSKEKKQGEVFWILHVDIDIGNNKATTWLYCLC